MAGHGKAKAGTHLRLMAPIGFPLFLTPSPSSVFLPCFCMHHHCKLRCPVFFAFPLSFLSLPTCSSYFTLLVPCFSPSFVSIIKRTHAPVPSLTSIELSTPRKQTDYSSTELSTSRKETDYLINRPLVHRQFSISNAGVKRYIFF